jgi:p-cumate 2,3-dioxygenase subunit beta
MPEPAVFPDEYGIDSVVEEFLRREAALLDEWRLDDWFALFTADCRYVVPTTDRPSGDPGSDVVLVDDDISRLRARVDRLKSRFAHREFPWSRTRHQVTDVLVRNRGDGVIEARANFAVYRFRRENAVFVGHYEYELVHRDGRLAIRSRRAVLDNETLDEHGAVSIIV